MHQPCGSLNSHVPYGFKKYQSYEPRGSKNIKICEPGGSNRSKSGVETETEVWLISNEQVKICDNMKCKFLKNKNKAMMEELYSVTYKNKTLEIELKSKKVKNKILKLKVARLNTILNVKELGCTVSEVVSYKVGKVSKEQKSEVMERTIQCKDVSRDEIATVGKRISWMDMEPYGIFAKMKFQSLEIEKLKLDLMVRDRTIESLKGNKEKSVKEVNSLSDLNQYKRDLQEISGVNRRINHGPCGLIETGHEPSGSTRLEPCGSKIKVKFKKTKIKVRFKGKYQKKKTEIKVKSKKKAKIKVKFKKIKIKVKFKRTKIKVKFKETEKIKSCKKRKEKRIWLKKPWRNKRYVAWCYKRKKKKKKNGGIHMLQSWLQCI